MRWFCLDVYLPKISYPTPSTSIKLRIRQKVQKCSLPVILEENERRCRRYTVMHIVWSPSCSGRQVPHLWTCREISNLLQNESNIDIILHIFLLTKLILSLLTNLSEAAKSLWGSMITRLCRHFIFRFELTRKGIRKQLYMMDPPSKLVLTTGTS